MPFDAAPVIDDVCHRAAYHDLDIFRDGLVSIHIRPMHSEQLGHAKDRTVTLYANRHRSEQTLADTLAHELRHVGQFARAARGHAFAPEYRSRYRTRPSEIDARRFAHLIAR